MKQKKLTVKKQYHLLPLRTAEDFTEAEKIQAELYRKFKNVKINLIGNCIEVIGDDPIV